MELWAWLQRVGEETAGFVVAVLTIGTLILGAGWLLGTWARSW